MYSYNRRNSPKTLFLQSIILCYYSSSEKKFHEFLRILSCVLLPQNTRLKWTGTTDLNLSVPFISSTNRTWRGLVKTDPQLLITFFGLCLQTAAQCPCKTEAILTIRSWCDDRQCVGVACRQLSVVAFSRIRTSPWAVALDDDDTVRLNAHFSATIKTTLKHEGIQTATPFCQEIRLPILLNTNIHISLFVGWTYMNQLRGAESILRTR